MFIAPLTQRLTIQQFDRFISHVEFSNTCWIWTGAETRGYGRVKINSRMEQAHRVAWEVWVGPIPDGLCLDHLCRNRLCLNPLHLEVVTIHENTRRGLSPSAIAAREDLCKNGHILSETRYVDPSGRKHGCGICRNEASKKAVYKKRGRVYIAK